MLFQSVEVPDMGCRWSRDQGWKSKRELHDDVSDHGCAKEIGYACSMKWKGDRNARRLAVLAGSQLH